MKRQKAPSGGPAFEAFYAEVWGERWSGLRAALLAEAPAFEWGLALTAPYSMDPASVLAALALGAAKGEACLDLCAAPGGKSLVLASRMEASGLTAVERSPERFMRLKRVLAGHLGPAALPRVEARLGDGAALCRKYPAAFDRILLDAPCSSERHVLSSPTHLARWTRARAKSIPFEQWALLSSAFAMLKPGGRLVYATCSISPAENEAMAARLAAKRGEAVIGLDARALVAEELAGLPEAYALALRPVLDSAEARDPGILILPDRARGAGPMYVAAFSKSVGIEAPGSPQSSLRLNIE